jgi:hypothetical protein
MAKRSILCPWRIPWNCQWQKRHRAHGWLKGIFYFHGVLHGTVNGNTGTLYMIDEREYFMFMEGFVELLMTMEGNRGTGHLVS